MRAVLVPTCSTLRRHGMEWRGGLGGCGSASWAPDPSARSTPRASSWPRGEKAVPVLSALT